MSTAAPAMPARFNPFATTWRVVFVQATWIMISALALAWLLRLVFSSDPVQAAWMLQVLLSIATLLAAIHGALQRRRAWAQPVEELKALLPEIHAGRVPIEHLSQVGGALAPLVPTLEKLLRELKQHRSAVARLELETSQRVAHRTDVLERKIGSLRQQATRDPLTGLYNRRLLDQHLPQLVQRALGERIPLSLLMLDIDYFKVLNDTLGHAAGDELLKSLGQVIRSSIREEDVAFRCGGDEMVIVLPNCDRETAHAKAQRLVALMDAMAKTLKVSPPPRLSIGVACTADEQESITAESLLAAADRELYLVKHSRHQHVKSR